MSSLKSLDITLINCCKKIFSKFVSCILILKRNLFMNALNVHDSKSLHFRNSGFVFAKNDFIQGYRFSVFFA